MRIKKIRLKEFKRFDDLTIDLGDNATAPRLQRGANALAFVTQ